MALVAETPRLRLEQLDIDKHAEGLFEVHSDARTFKYIYDKRIPHQSLQDTKDLLAARLKDPERPWVTACAIILKRPLLDLEGQTSEEETPQQAKIIGLVATPRLFRGAPEVGYAFHADFGGRGLGTEAVSAFVKARFADTDVSRLYALTEEEHLGSRRLLEKLGFVEDGREGAEEGDLVYRLERGFFEERMESVKKAHD